MLTPHHFKSFSVPSSIRPLTLAVTLSRVSTIHPHHFDVDMAAEQCVLGDTHDGEKEATDWSKSEAELVEADTIKRAISERR